MDKIFTKRLHLKEYTATRLTDEFPQKNRTKRGVDKQLKSCETQAQLTAGQAVAYLAKTSRQLMIGFFS